MKEPKDRIDLPNERLIGETDYTVPVSILKKNPLIKNKGQVCRTFIIKDNTMQEKTWSGKINSARNKVSFKDYLGVLL